VTEALVSGWASTHSTASKLSEAAARRYRPDPETLDCWRLKVSSRKI